VSLKWIAQQQQESTQAVELTTIHSKLPEKQEGLTKDLDANRQVFNNKKMPLYKTTWNCIADNTPREILTRLYKVAEVTINPTWTTPQDLQFPDALLQIPTIETALRPFRWMRAGVEICVKLNSTTFHQGMCCGYFRSDMDAAAISLDIFEASFFDPVYFNYSTADTATMTYHWTCPVNCLTISDNTEKAAIGIFSLLPVVPIVNASGGSDTIVATILARFIDPVCMGYKIVTPCPPGKVRKQSFVPSETQTKSNNLSLFGGGTNTRPSAILKPVNDFIGDIEDLGDMVAGIFDKPTLLTAPQKTYYDPGMEYCSAEGASMAARLTMYPVSQGLGEIDFTQDSSRMTIKKLCSIPILHQFSNFSASNANLEIPCHPVYRANQNEKAIDGDTYVRPDYLMLCNDLHMYWRGTLLYHFKFVTSSFVTGRIRISLMNEDVPDESGGDFPAILLNINGTTECTVKVPFIHTYHMARTQPAAITTKLYIQWESPPINSGGSEPVVNMLVFRFGGPDTVFSSPTTYQFEGVGNKLVRKQSRLRDSVKKQIVSFTQEDRMVYCKGYSVSSAGDKINDYLKSYSIRNTSLPNRTYDLFTFEGPDWFEVGDIEPQLAFASIFKYVRGGVRISCINTVSTTPNFITPSLNLNSYNPGAGIYVNLPDENRLSVIEIPYYSEAPYIPKTSNPKYRSPYNPQHVVPALAGNAAFTLTAAADEREMFMLLPPTPYFVPAPQRTKPKQLKKEKEKVPTT